MRIDAQRCGAASDALDGGCVCASLCSPSGAQSQQLVSRLGCRGRGGSSGSAWRAGRVACESITPRISSDPHRFWGVTERLPPQCAWVCRDADLRDAMDGDRNPAWNRVPIFADVASASFLLTDATGRSFELFLCGLRDHSCRTLCFALSRSDGAASFTLCASFDAAPTGWSRDATTITIDPKALMAAGYEPRASDHCNSNSSSCSTPDQAAVTTSSAVLKQRVAHELGQAFLTAMPLLKFSLYGPTLFSDNHPPAMRRLFTAHLLDECMLAAGLTPLPLVLSELIANYHSFDLPFREDRAKEQMSQAGFKLRLQDPINATYEGQLDSAVERVCDSDSAWCQIRAAADARQRENNEAKLSEADQ